MNMYRQFPMFVHIAFLKLLHKYLQKASSKLVMKRLSRELKTQHLGYIYLPTRHFDIAPEFYKYFLKFSFS